MVINLEINEINYILNVLGNTPLPYLQVKPIIDKILEQGKENEYNNKIKN